MCELFRAQGPCIVGQHASLTDPASLPSSQSTPPRLKSPRASIVSRGVPSPAKSSLSTRARPDSTPLRVAAEESGDKPRPTRRRAQPAPEPSELGAKPKSPRPRKRAADGDATPVAESKAQKQRENVGPASEKKSRSPSALVGDEAQRSPSDAQARTLPRLGSSARAWVARLLRQPSSPRKRPLPNGPSSSETTSTASSAGAGDDSETASSSARLQRAKRARLADPETTVSSWQAEAGRVGREIVVGIAGSVAAYVVATVLQNTV